MQLDGIITRNTIDLQLFAETKEEALEKLADMLYKDSRLSDIECFLKDVYQRETTGTTDMGIGVAIPHGKSEAVLHTSVAIGRLTTPLRWDLKIAGQLQEKPVYAIFLLAVSIDNQSTTHLELISSIASLLINESFIVDLQNATSKEMLLDSIQKHLGELE
ncbi:MAG: PTS sugar transporter subunit IIA [Anaerolineales bacterium]|nr:PTS sugar transporter subunit IIA [Anaerolineales bacterium]